MQDKPAAAAYDTEVFYTQYELKIYCFSFREAEITILRNVSFPNQE